MDTPVAPPSFIPKKPLTTSRLQSGNPLGVLIFFAAVLMFIASAVAGVFAFGYQSYLKSSIANKSDSLTKAEAAFDINTIEDLTRLDTRMRNTESLLQQHHTAMATLLFLGEQTLQNVQFTKYDYAVAQDGSAKISLSGVADSFATVALQSDQFGASKMLKEVVFSGITVTPDNKIDFDVAADVDPSLINYAKNLGTSPSPNSSTTPATFPPNASSTLQ